MSQQQTITNAASNGSLQLWAAAGSAKRRERAQEPDCPECHHVTDTTNLRRCGKPDNRTVKETIISRLVEAHSISAEL